MAISDSIWKACGERRYTLKELARRAGIPYTTLHSIVMRGSDPKYETLCRIANALEVPISQLVEGDHPKIALHYEDVNVDMDRLIFDAYEAYNNCQKKSSKRSIEKKIGAILRKLNDDGLKKALERVEELTEIPRYQRQESTAEGADTKQNKAAPDAANTESGKDDTDH